MSVYERERKLWQGNRGLGIILFVAMLAVSAYWIQRGWYLGAILLLFPVTITPIAIGLSDRLVYAIELIAVIGVVAVGFMWPWRMGIDHAPYILAVLGLGRAVRHSSAITGDKASQENDEPR